MSRNIWQDNRPLTAAVLNSLASAIGGVSTISGCTPTVGTNAWDVDVASGTVRVDGTGDVSVSSQTVDLNDPTSDLAAGESRVVLVTINDSGTASATEGTAATDPATPDIPTSEVVVAVVYVTDADANLSEADLYDIRTLFGDGANSGLNAELLVGNTLSEVREIERETFDESNSSSVPATEEESATVASASVTRAAIIGMELSAQKDDPGGDSDTTVTVTYGDSSTESITVSEPNTGTTTEKFTAAAFDGVLAGKNITDIELSYFYNNQVSDASVSFSSDWRVFAIEEFAP